MNCALAEWMTGSLKWPMTVAAAVALTSSVCSCLLNERLRTQCTYRYVHIHTHTGRDTSDWSIVDPFACVPVINVSALWCHQTESLGLPEVSHFRLPAIMAPYNVRTCIPYLRRAQQTKALLYNAIGNGSDVTCIYPLRIRIVTA